MVRRLVGVMRCLTCNVEMRLIEVTRDDTMWVPGYAYHTMQCPDCHDIERRLVFRRTGSTMPFAVPSPSEPSAASPPIEPAPVTPPVASVNRLAQSAPAPTAPPASPVIPTIEPVVSPPTTPASVSATSEPVAPFTAAPAAAHLPDPVAPPPTPPRSITSEADLDEGEALLRRAMEMVRSPTNRLPSAEGPGDHRPETPAELAGLMASRRPFTGRLVRIQRDSDEIAYVAKDARSGLSVLRHQDRARLRAMCDRIGWRVVDIDVS